MRSPSHVTEPATVWRHFLAALLALCAVVWGAVPSEWIESSAFPSLRTMDLTNAYLGDSDSSLSGFGDSWYTQGGGLGGLPNLRQLALWNPFSSDGRQGGGGWCDVVVVVVVYEP